jgi:D-alanyl-D-alanine carboxypeptidase
MRPVASRSLVALVLALVAPLAPPSEVNSAPDPGVPRLSAEAWMLYDAGADLVIASRNAEAERPMASVTKIMTALVVVDQADLDDETRISASAADVGESEIGLVRGELWTVRDLLAAVLVRSANDAAMALAEYVGGSVAGFADLMNQKAADLGLEHSHFTNPHGLDEEDHYTSAGDLVLMARALLADEYLARLVRTKLITFKPDPSGVDRRAPNTNQLLGVYPGVVGIKTGFTNEAGRVLVSALERNGRTLIAVVMGSEDHFADARALLEYGYDFASLDAMFLAPLLEEEGGGAVPSAVPLTRADRSRLAQVASLADGRESVSPFVATGLGRRVDDWLRSTMPVTLGGRP